MVQKSFMIKTREEADRVVEVLRECPLSGCAGQILLQVFSFGFSYEDVNEIIRPIREEFPNILPLGLSVFFTEAPKTEEENIFFDQTPVIRLGFMFFEKPRVKVMKYELEKNDATDVSTRAREMIKNEKDVKGVGIYISGFFVNISPFLEKITEGFYDIPFFGTMADAYYIADKRKEPYIFARDEHLEKGVIFVLFTGEDFFVEEQYIFGWKPIGKPMAIETAPHDPEIGDTVVSKIDGVPPEEIYNKYLGIKLDEYLTINCCEFPLVIERDGLLIGRTPYGTNDKKELNFVGSIRPGERVRFSYTVREDLISNTERESHKMMAFKPQAIQLFVCGNRAVMLRSETMLELECFSRIVSDSLYCGAAGEIYYYHGQGGFLNSALVAIGFREGEPKEFHLGQKTCELIYPKTQGVIPLSERTARFLNGMSGDLIDFAKAAKRANEAKSAFLAKMSHEIRTPINAVLGMDEMILRESEDDTTLSYAADIQSAGRTLLSLINDILDFSKVEEGKMEIIPTQYDLSSVINDLYNMIRPRAEKKGLSFIINVNEHMPHILYGDEIRIRQCALNVLSNAVKYTEKGSVTLDVDYELIDFETMNLIFRVKDTGIGMKEEDMSRLFSPFERIEEKRNRSIEGTGLGMSITKQLLSLMGSELEVSSVYGEGSTFSFAVEQQIKVPFPIGSFKGRYENAAARTVYKELFHAPDARILVVDDTEVNLTVVLGLLKKTKINIDTAKSGREAVALCEKNEYDAVFIDHMMPDMDGIETLSHIREAGKNTETPAIALTANAVSGAREMYMDAGFNDYLAKPVDGSRLEKMLFDILPDEKVIKDWTEEPAEKLPKDASEETSEGEIPSWLKNISEINISDALTNCGDESGFISVLTVFHQTAKAKAEEIKKLWEDKDIENYTVKVHALKSSARIIGAAELSALAKSLEDAGKALDTDFIKAHTQKLLTMYRSLDEKLDPLGKKEDDLPKITPEAMREAYQTIAEIAESMDYGMLDDMLSDLSKYSLLPEDKERIDKIEMMLTELDFQGIAKAAKD